jgi:hypothetical protein
VTEDGVHVSTFRAAVREARALTRRDVGTGRPVTPPCNCQPLTEFSGALMYLITLELAGKTLRPVGRRAIGGKKGRDEQDIGRAIRYFGPWITPDERDALVALRNSFAHDFGLTHGRTPNPARWHRFALVSDDAAPLVTFPQQRWNKKYGAASKGGATIVNLAQLARSAELIVKEVERAAKARELRITTGVHIAEFGSRFGFSVTP